MSDQISWARSYIAWGERKFNLPHKLPIEQACVAPDENWFEDRPVITIKAEPIKQPIIVSRIAQEEAGFDFDELRTDE